MSAKTKIIFWIKLIVSLLSFIYIAYLIVKQLKSFNTITDSNWQSNLNYEFLIYCFLLLPLNWGIESLKWKRLVKPLYILTFNKSLQSVLSGVAVSIFTPNRVGEFAGRIIILPTQIRIKGAIASLIGSFTQVLSTVLFGAAGIFFFAYKQVNFDLSSLSIKTILSITLVIIGLLGILVMLARPILKKFGITKEKVLNTILFIKKYQWFDLIYIALLSIIRYFVFSLQFVLLMYFFNSNISISYALAGVFLTFLISTLVPSVALVEFGIRGSIAAFIFSFFTQNPIPIIAASTTLWVINLALPALFGTLIWNKFKI